MAISDLFSTSFLFCIAIIIILMGSLFIYLSYKMAEQDHKLSSMVNLVSILAQDLQMVKSKMAVVEQDFHFNEKLQYPSDIMGGNGSNDLISVSDDEDLENDNQDDDDESDDDESENNESEDDLSIYDQEDDDSCISNEEVIDESPEQIKILNLTLVNGDMVDEIENSDTPDNQDIKTIHIEAPFELEESEIYNIDNSTQKDIINLNENNDLPLNNNFSFKNIKINDLGEADDNQTFKSDYKKMSINKLREVVVSKGVIADASKLKKNEILKMLGDE